MCREVASIVRSGFTLGDTSHKPAYFTEKFY